MQTINIPKHNSLSDKDTAGNHAKIIPVADSTTAVININTTDAAVYPSVDSARITLIKV